MMRRLTTAAVFLLLCATALDAAPAVQLAPGNYLIPFGGVVYASSLPTRVVLTPQGLQWRIEVYDQDQVYQGTQVMLWGWQGDVVLQARDYDGDGVDDPAVYRPWTGQTFVRRSKCDEGFWNCYYVLEAH